VSDVRISAKAIKTSVKECREKTQKPGYIYIYIYSEVS
jgi:hypothetical protein